MSHASEQRRDERIRALKDAEWNLETLFELHYWLTHRSQKAQQNALHALLDIVDRNPDAIRVSPLDLLKDVICPLAFGSGAVDLIFYLLAERNTRAADEAMKEILRDSGTARNQDFQKFIEIAIANDKRQLLSVLNDQALSQTKSKILRQALKEK
jgi:hypothetical protein